MKEIGISVSAGINPLLKNEPFMIHFEYIIPCCLYFGKIFHTMAMCVQRLVMMKQLWSMFGRNTV